MQHNNSNQSTSSSIPQLSHNTIALKQPSGKLSSNSNNTAYSKSAEVSGSYQRQHVGRREGDKSATADSHISQLKMVWPDKSIFGLLEVKYSNRTEPTGYYR